MAWAPDEKGASAARAGYGRAMLAFIGCGDLAEAVVRGALAQGTLTLGGFLVTARRPERAARLAAHGWLVVDNLAAASAADMIVLGVRHPDLLPLLAEIRSCLDGRLVVSLAVGIPSTSIEAAAPGARVVRAIPNTPMAVGKGVTILAPGRSAAPGDLARVEGLFSGVGRIVHSPESALNAWNALSGVGPAYYFELARSLEQAAIREGLPAAEVRATTRATLLGAAALLDATAATPAELVAQVSGPGGSTRAALDCLAAGKADGLLEAAFRAAVQRASDRDSAALSTAPG